MNNSGYFAGRLPLFERRYEKKAMIKKRNQKITPLYNLIQKREWDEAIARLRRHPKESREWYIRFCNDGRSIMERFLPIHTACRLNDNFNESSLELLKLLIKAYPESTKLSDMKGMLPLHWACWGKASAKVIEVLLYSRKDSAGKVDAFQRLPIHLVCDHGPYEEAVVTLLRKHYTASVNMKDMWGRTPLDIAEEREFFHVLAMLKRQTQSEQIQILESGQSQTRRPTDTTTTSTEFSNLPELDRVAKRASERARKASIAAGHGAPGITLEHAAKVVANSLDDNNQGNAHSFTAPASIAPPVISISISSESCKPPLLGSNEYGTNASIVINDEESKLFYESIELPTRRSDAQQKNSFSKSMSLDDFGYTSFSEEGHRIIVDGNDEEVIYQDQFTVIGNDTNNGINEYSGMDDESQLCRLILNKEWDEAIRYIRNGHEEEAERWRRFCSVDGSVHWRLPIHDACIYQPSLELIEALVDAFKAGPGCTDDLKKLPIHWACEFGASEKVVEHLLNAKPLSIFEEDIYKHTPLMCAKRSKFPNKEVIEASLLMEPTRSRPGLVSESSDRTLITKDSSDIGQKFKNAGKSHTSSERTLIASNFAKAYSTSVSSKSSDESFVAKSTDGTMGLVNIRRSSDESNGSFVKKFNLNNLPELSFGVKGSDEKAIQLDPNTPGPIIHDNSIGEELSRIVGPMEAIIHGKGNIFLSTFQVVKDTFRKTGRKLKNPSLVQNYPGDSEGDDSTKNDEETIESPTSLNYINDSVLVEEKRTLYCFGRRCVMFGGLFLVAIGLGFIAVLIKKLSPRNSYDDSNSDTDRTVVVGNNETVVVEVVEGREAEIREVLETISTKESLDDDSTPQGMALNWILDDDSMQLNATDSNLLQRYSITTMFYAVGGIEWETDMNWINTSLHECKWNGRKEYRDQGILNCTDNNVTDIFFSQIGIGGELPSEISVLQNLTKFEAPANKMSRSIPSELGLLSNLEVLNIAGNSFTGMIPSELGLLSKLKRLELNTNRLDGNIPSTLGNLNSLEMAWFHSNTISGTMPRAVCDLTNLKLNRLWADCEEIDDNGHITSPLITCDCCHACFFN